MKCCLGLAEKKQFYNMDCREQENSPTDNRPPANCHPRTIAPLG